MARIATPPTLRDELLAHLRRARVRPLRGLHSLAVAPCAVCYDILYLDADGLARYVVESLKQAGIFRLAEFAFLDGPPVLMINFSDGAPASTGAAALMALIEVVRPARDGPLARYFVGFSTRIFDPTVDDAEVVARLLIDSILDDLCACWSEANMEAVS